MNVPAIDDNIIGDIPDAHAKRVVGEMLDFLTSLTDSFTPALEAAVSRPIGGSPVAQHRFVARVRQSGCPAVIDVSVYYGKRCKFGLMLSVWYADENGGATVWQYFARADGPGTEKRTAGPLWRITNHALVRLVQRSGAHDAMKLLAAMREIGKVILHAMAGARLLRGDGKVLYVKFNGGTVVVEWPEDSDMVLAKTILSPDMAHPLPGLH